MEHAYQAAKSDDPEVWETFQTFKSPGKAKRAGQVLEIRSDWEQVKISVMTGLVRQKFNIVGLGNLLKATNPQELIEGNSWGDCFWGVCNGVGQNNLGKILMAVRTDLISRQSLSKSP